MGGMASARPVGLLAFGKESREKKKQNGPNPAIKNRSNQIRRAIRQDRKGKRRKNING